jgi:hypothetical protein
MGVRNFSSAEPSALAKALAGAEQARAYTKGEPL